MKNKSWNLIDTAPTDGTAILLWPYVPFDIFEGKADAEVVIGFFTEDRDGWWFEGGFTTFEPTHWMPLPEAPDIDQ